MIANVQNGDIVWVQTYSHNSKSGDHKWVSSGAEVIDNNTRIGVEVVLITKAGRRYKTRHIQYSKRDLFLTKELCDRNIVRRKEREVKRALTVARQKVEVLEKELAEIQKKL